MKNRCRCSRASERRGRRTSPAANHKAVRGQKRRRFDGPGVRPIGDRTGHTRPTNTREPIDRAPRSRGIARVCRAGSNLRYACIGLIVYTVPRAAAAIAVKPRIADEDAYDASAIGENARASGGRKAVLLKQLSAADRPTSALSHYAMRMVVEYLRPINDDG